MKTFLVSALLAATAAALPQGLGQVTRIVITDTQATAVAVPRNAEPQHLGPVSRTVIYDSQPTRIAVARNAEPQHLGPVSRTVIYDSQPTVLSVPRNEVPSVGKRQSIGLCMSPILDTISSCVTLDRPLLTIIGTSDDSCATGYLCAALGDGYSVCLPDLLYQSVVASVVTASRTTVDDTPVSSTSAIEATDVALAGRH